MQSHLFIKIFILNYLTLLARKLKCQVLSARKSFANASNRLCYEKKSGRVPHRKKTSIVHILFYKQLDFFGQTFGCLSYRTISGLKLLTRLLTN